ncbi:unnamed protein product [Ixodes hexagonus]
MLRYLSNQWNSARTQACTDFYELVCGPWHHHQGQGMMYQDADGALSAEIEAQVRNFLNGQEAGDLEPLFRFWKSCLDLDMVPLERVMDLARGLGLDLSGSMASSSKERLLGLAVTLVQEFGLYSLLTVELDRDPEGMAAYLIAIDEPEMPLGKLRPPASWNLVTTRRMLTNVGADLAGLLAPGGDKARQASESFANVAMAFTSREREEEREREKKRDYISLSLTRTRTHARTRTRTHAQARTHNLQALAAITSVEGCTASRRSISNFTLITQYGERQFYVETYPVAYNPDLIARRTARARLQFIFPPQSDITLRRHACLDGHQLACVAPYSQVSTGHLHLSDQMAVYEVRTYEQLHFLHPVSVGIDVWNVRKSSQKALNGKIYRPFQWKLPASCCLFLLQCFLSMRNSSPLRNIVRRAGVHSSVTMHCSSGLKALERCIDPSRAYKQKPPLLNFYEPEGAWWTEQTRALVDERTSCLQRRHDDLMDMKHPERRNYDPPYLSGLSDLEDTVGVRVALKIYKDRLYTNRYLNRDYRFAGAEDISSQELFFIYYARSLCEVPDTFDRFMNSHLSSKSSGLYR